MSWTEHPFNSYAPNRRVWVNGDKTIILQEPGARYVVTRGTKALGTTATFEEAVTLANRKSMRRPAGW